MSRGINKVMLVGNLGNNPEIRHLPSGDAVANLSLATSESWKDKSTGEPKELTEWHRIVCFGRLAEIVGEYLQKGAKVYFEGSLRTRKWQDRDGNDRYTTEIRATDMQMLDSRADRDRQAPESTAATASPTPAAPPASARASATAVIDDDIPFARPAALDGLVFPYDGA